MDAGMVERMTASAVRTSCDLRALALVWAGSFMPRGASHPGVSSIVANVACIWESTGGVSMSAGGSVCPNLEKTLLTSAASAVGGGSSVGIDCGKSVSLTVLWKLNEIWRAGPGFDASPIRTLAK
eukprot:511010-Amphidinium_carterae.1